MADDERDTAAGPPRRCAVESDGTRNRDVLTLRDADDGENGVPADGHVLRCEVTVALDPVLAPDQDDGGADSPGVEFTVQSGGQLPFGAVGRRLLGDGLDGGRYLLADTPVAGRV